MDFLPPFRKAKRLPAVFSWEEVKRILAGAANLKHQAMLTLIYSSGLRVSELPGLRPADVLRSKMQLRINQGKGRKDRITVLSHQALALLGRYWKQYQPQVWLFEGRTKGTQINPRSVQHAYYKAKEKAGISRSAGIHTLRHSFATHTLETGGGIFQLQKLLGHKQLRTTLVYLHLQNEKILLQSPLDVYGKA